MTRYEKIFLEEGFESHGLRYQVSERVGWVDYQASSCQSVWNLLFRWRNSG